MNVLLASPWPLDFRGGVTVVVRMLGRGLARSGDQVAYLVPTHGRGIQRSEDAGLPVFYVPMRLASVPAHPLRGRISFLLHFPLTCFRLARILRRQKIDVVNAHYFTAHWIYFLFLRLFLRFRLVISVHGTDVQGSEGQKNIQRMERWQRRIDKLVFCSEASRQQTLPPTSGLYSKTAVVWNAIETDALPPPELAGNREEFVICVGHLQEHKGQDVLIRALQKIVHDAPSRHVTLKLVGEGPTRTELETLARTLGVEDRVQFCGGLPREEALNLMRTAAITCVPSRRETFGLVLLESMALEVPLVATRVGGIPEVVRDGQEALLVPSEDPAALARAIQRLLQDKALGQNLARSAKQRLQQTFTSERFDLAYRGVLQSALGDEAAPKAETR